MKTETQPAQTPTSETIQALRDVLLHSYLANEVEWVIRATTSFEPMLTFLKEMHKHGGPITSLELGQLNSLIAKAEGR